MLPPNAARGRPGLDKVWSWRCLEYGLRSGRRLFQLSLCFKSEREFSSGWDPRRRDALLGLSFLVAVKVDLKFCLAFREGATVAVHPRDGCEPKTLYERGIE